MAPSGAIQAKVTSSASGESKWSHALHGGQGRTRTYGVSDVTDLQSAAIAAMLTCPNAFPVTEKLPETDETKCEPSTSGTQNGDRHCR